MSVNSWDDHSTEYRFWNFLQFRIFFFPFLGFLRTNWGSNKCRREARRNRLRATVFANGVKACDFVLPAQGDKTRNRKSVQKSGEASLSKFPTASSCVEEYPGHFFLYFLRLLCLQKLVNWNFPTFVKSTKKCRKLAKSRISKLLLHKS